MAKKTSKTSSSSTELSQSVSGFAILEHALRITHVIIKIAIELFVPKGQGVFDPGVVF